MEAEDEIPRCRTLLCAVQTGGKYFGKLLKNMCENTVHKTFYNVLDENFYKHDILHLWKNDKCCLCGVSAVHHYAGSLKQRQILSVYSTIDRKCGRIPCKFCPCSFKAKEGVCTSNTDITFSHALLRRVFLKSVHPSLPTFNVRRAVDEIKKIRNTAVHYPETPLHRVDFDKEWLNLKSSLLIICKYLKESTDMLEEEMEKFHYLVNTCKDCSFRIKASLERMKYGELKDSNDNGIVGNPFQMFAVCQECARIQEGCKDAHSLIFDNLHLFMGLTPFEFLPDLEEAGALTEEDVRHIKSLDKRAKQMEAFLSILKERGISSCRKTLDILSEKDYGPAIREMRKEKKAGCEITFAVNGNFDVEEVNALQQKTKDHTTEQSSGVGKYDLRFSVLGHQKDKIEKILKDFIESEDFSSKLKDMGPEDISVTNGSVIVHLTFKCQEDYDKFSVAVSEGKLFDIVSRMWDEVKCNHKIDKQDAKMIVYIQNVPGRLADSGKTECSAAFFIDTNNDFLTEELCPGTLIKYLKESHIDISEAIRIRKEHPFDRRTQSQELLKFLRNESFEFIQKCLFATQPETIKRKLEESMSSVEVIIQCDHCRKRRICNKELERVTCDACLKQDHAIESRNFQLYTTYSQALPRVPPPTQSQADILAQNTEHAVPGSPIIRGRNEPDAINETRMENKRDTRSAAVTMATKVKEEPTSQKNTVEPDTCTSSRKVRGKRGCIEEAESTPIGKKVKQEKTTPTKAVEAPLRRSPRRSPSPARLPSPARESSPVRQSQDKTKLGTNKLSVNKTRTGKVIVEDSDEEPTTSNKTNTRSTRTMKGKDDCVSKREDDLFESDDLFEVSSSSRKAAPKTKRKKVSESEEDEMPRSKRGRKNIVSLDSEEEKSEDKRQKKDKDSEKSDEEMRKKDKEERGIEDSDNDDMFEVKPASSRRRDAEKRDRSEAADNGVGSNGSQRSPEKRMSREQRSPVRVKREVRDQSHTLSEGTEPGFINTSDPSENVVKKELTNTKEEDQPSNCFVVKFVSLVARQPKPRAENSEETPEGYTRWKGKVVKNFKKFRKSSHAGAGSLPRIIGGSDLEPHIASRSKEIEDWFREEERALSQKSEMERQADELFEDNLEDADIYLREAKAKYAVLKEEFEVADQVIRKIAAEIQGQEFRGRIGGILYGSTGVISGGVSLIGLALAPYTAGVSLLLLAGGAAVGISSALASIAHNVIKDRIMNKGVEEAIKLLESVSKKWEEIHVLLVNVVHCLDGLNPSNVRDAGKFANWLLMGHTFYRASKALHLIRVGKFEKLQNFLVIGKVTDMALTKVGSTFGRREEIGVRLVETTKGVTWATSKIMIPLTILGMLIDVKNIAENSYKIHKKKMNEKAEALIKSVDQMEDEMKIMSEILED